MKNMTRVRRKRSRGSRRTGSRILGLSLIAAIIVLIVLFAGVYWMTNGKNNNAGKTSENSNSISEQETENLDDSNSITRTEMENESLTEEHSQTELTSELQTESESQIDTQLSTDVSDFLMFFTGDILLRNNTLTGYNKKGINGIISEYLESEMVGANLTMVNEEFPFSTNGEPMPDKQYTFRTDPEYVKVFQEMGVDVVSLANNHALDYGKDALSDTFLTLDLAGIPYVGAGETKERAEEAIFVEANGRKVGVLSASRVIPVVGWNIVNEQPGLFCTYSSARLVQRIKEVEEECDFVVVYVHWGLEYKEHPEEYQRKLAQEYIDAGADLVVGSHSHVPQGIEYYKGVPIVYCLGNFIFSPNTVDTYTIRVNFTAEGETILQVIPVAAKNAQTSELIGTDKQEFLDYLEGISYDVEIDENGMVTNVSVY